MKKLIAIALTVAMLIACLAGCGSTETASSGSKSYDAYVIAQKGDTYSLGLSNNFKTAFEALGGTVLMETFPAETTNFSDYIQKAMDNNVKIIFSPNSTAVAANLLKNAQDLGVECPIMGGDTWESSVILDGQKGADFDVYCTTFFDESDSNAVAKEFVTGFKAWLNKNSDKKDMNGGNDIVAAVSALGFDGYNVAMAAIREAAAEKGSKLTSVDVANKLWTLDFKDAVTGEIKFDGTGDAIKDSAYIKKAAETSFEFVKVQTIENDAAQSTGFDYGDKTGIALDTESKKIVIGIYEPTSGDNAAGGKQEVIGIQYANSLDHTVTIDGVDYEVELYLADNGSLEANAGAAASSITAQGALVSLGSYGSGVSIAAADTFAEAGVPAIGLSCTNASVTDGHDFYLRICFLDPFQGSVAAGFAWEIIQ